MKKILLILLSCCFLQLWGQTNNKNQELTIRVVSKVDNEPIERAAVEIRGLITKKTNSDGKVLFEDVPKRNYTIVVIADDFMPYRSSYNVGEMYNYDDNYWDIELESLPRNSFLIIGKVVHKENPVENVKVHFRAISKKRGDVKYDVYTDELGFYSVIMDKDEIENSEKIMITLEKQGFKIETKDIGIFRDNITEDFELSRKINYYKTAKYGSFGIGGATLATGLALALDTRSDWKNSNRGQVLYDSLNRKFKKRTTVAGIGLIFLAGGVFLHCIKNEKKDKDKISRIQLTPKISNLAFLDPNSLNQNSYEVGLTINF